MQPNGEHGGVVLRSLKTAGGILHPGTEIEAEKAMSWTVANRRALSEGGIVRWHSRPAAVDEVDAEEAEADEPAKRRGRPPKDKE